MKAALSTLVTLCVATLLLSGCSKGKNTNPVVKPDAPIIKIAVFADGRITADGKQVTIEVLHEKFAKLAEQKGEVWYYRESGQSDPPPQAMQVMQEVVDARLPIKLSSKPDYSDAVGIDVKPVQ